MGESYHFNLHKHNYATWTAARAVQRGFAKTDKIKLAIEDSDLRKFAEDELSYTAEEYNTFHSKVAKQIIRSFAKNGIKEVTYGRAAKIISVYLKTSVILCSKGECNKSKVIHPPIDRILLQSMAASNKELKTLSVENWTGLNEEDYWKLVKTIKSHFKKFDWTLEEYWTI